MTTRRSLLAAFLLLGVQGCATTSDGGTSFAAKSPELTADEKQKFQAFNYSGLKSKDKNVEITIAKTILPGDPDYFPTNRAWAEYVVELRVSADTLTVKDFRLVAAEGAYVSAASNAMDITKLPTAQELYKDSAVAGAATVGVGTAVALAGAVIPFAGLLAAPLMLVGGTMSGNSTMKKVDDADAYDKAFKKRVLRANSAYDRNSVATASVFFPMIDNPRAFVLDYTTSDGIIRQIRVPIGQVVNRKS